MTFVYGPLLGVWDVCDTATAPSRRASGGAPRPLAQELSEATMQRILAARRRAVEREAARQRTIQRVRAVEGGTVRSGAWKLQQNS